MDVIGAQKGSRERLYSRAPSRASTEGTVNTQMTSKSASSSSSRLREITHTGSHATHKYHHSRCSGGSVSIRPTSRLSKEPGDDLPEPTSASSFLQERIQKKRNERQTSKSGGDLSASTGDIRERDVQNSPVRRSATAIGRRQRSDSDDELAKDAGMGARQMEQTLSTLHKQNFDLKLELYHRREKQTMLEERVEKLESQNSEMIDLHKSIARELEMKDDALAEAVTLIVELETRIDDLVREREMVRRVEVDGSYRHSSSGEPDVESTAAAAPRAANLAVPALTGHARSLGRVPSFLSEHNQQTENLRNAVLKGRSSVLHTRKVSESSIDPSEINRIASPNLSVLSESSFVSIYGAKGADGKAGLQPSANLIGMDGSCFGRSSTTITGMSDRGRGAHRGAPLSQKPTDSPGGGAKLSPHIKSANNVIDINSPLQKLERLEERMIISDGIFSQHVGSRGRGTATPTSGRPPMNPPQAKTKQEKREALQKVLTSYHMHRDFSNPHAFPPTPDTVSSSTLRNQQNFTSSQDSFTRQAATVLGEGLVPVHERIENSAKEPTYQTSSNQQKPTTILAGRRQIPMPTINTNMISDISQFARSLPPRPHSAAETMSSRARADSIRSDSDSDGGADARSEADSFDYWMRESMKPNRNQTGSSELRGSGRPASPDLFSFPADTRGWETDVIFGALKGSGYLGSPVSALKRDPIDEMASSLTRSQAEVFDPPMMGPAPPTPDRRSSLHARTGSTSAIPSGGNPKKHPAKNLAMAWAGERGRSHSIDSAAPASSTEAHPQPPEGWTSGKRNQYPPISGQASKGRGLGLHSFFRKSGSDNLSLPSSATEGSFPTPTQLPSLPPTRTRSAKPPGRNSVPPPATMPWRPPGVVEDDFKSATPPPIMRRRGMSLLSGIGGVEVVDSTTPKPQAAETGRPSTPTTAVHANPATSGGQSGSRRKWLGLGRMGSLKNRMG